MGGDHVVDQVPGVSGVVRWLCVQDDLLRALAHSLSNRIGTVLALASVLETGTASAGLGTALMGETERMEQLLQRLRELPRGTEPRDEPMLAVDALHQACQLVMEHPAARDGTIAIEAEGEVPPVRADPVAVQQAWIVALLAAFRTATDGRVIARLRAAGDQVACDVVAAEPATASEVADDRAAIAWLLGAGRGTVLPETTACGFSLPTLASTRAARPSSARPSSAPPGSAPPGSPAAAPTPP